jgi:hypothetical protein
VFFIRKTGSQATPSPSRVPPTRLQLAAATASPSSPTPTRPTALPLLPGARVRLAAEPPSFPSLDSGFRFPAANFPFPFSAPPSRPSGNDSANSRCQVFCRQTTCPSSGAGDEHTTGTSTYSLPFLQCEIEPPKPDVCCLFLDLTMYSSKL